MCYSGRCEYERDGQECMIYDRQAYNKKYHCSPCIVGGYYNNKDTGYNDILSMQRIKLNNIICK